MACKLVLNTFYRILKNAHSGRFFIPALILFSSSAYSQDKQAPDCVSTHFDEKVFVDYVIDGDTVVLEDKRHIRLIGINTPELSHNDTPSESGAEIARDALIQMVRDQTFIYLLYGKERFDRHGRTLAHLYLKNGTNVQAEILSLGLAMPLRIPPNLSKQDCYTSASQLAKMNKSGLWSLARYQTKKTALLAGNEKGFYFISGKVKRVSESRSALWINLENNVALRIVKEDLANFNKDRLLSLVGKTIEASGWLYKRKGQLRMRIRHPLDLTDLTSHQMN